MSHSLSSLLFYPFEKNILEWPSGEILLWNTQYSMAAKMLPSFDCVNSFKPDALTWDISFAAKLSKDKIYKTILCEVPKQKTAAFYMLARSLQQLEENGLLLAMASNDAGGKRLEKWFQEFGLAPQSASKQKCRIVWARKTQVNKETIDKYMKQGAPQKIILQDKAYITQAGIFGWDKIDKGSALLAHYLPDTLSGVGADFGCGYGYLSSQILSKPSKIKKLYAIDADYNALECAKANLKDYEGNVDIVYAWEDLTKAPEISEKLDWIVMNPPFHEGKKTDAAIGQSFIEAAFLSLKKHGILYMVANVHLPYERALLDKFTTVEKSIEENGFKIFKAKLV